jgi:hypothetical protein
LLLQQVPLVRLLLVLPQPVQLEQLLLVLLQPVQLERLPLALPQQALQLRLVRLLLELRLQPVPVHHQQRRNQQRHHRHQRHPSAHHHHNQLPGKYTPATQVHSEIVRTSLNPAFQLHKIMPAPRNPPFRQPACCHYRTKTRQDFNIRGAEISELSFLVRLIIGWAFCGLDLSGPLWQAVAVGSLVRISLSPASRSFSHLPVVPT